MDVNSFPQGNDFTFTLSGTMVNKGSCYIFKNCAIWLWNMVSYIKGIWKQDPQANILAQEGWEGNWEGPRMRNFIIYTVHLIYSGVLNLEN